jgi:hypothetical protein
MAPSPQPICLDAVVKRKITSPYRDSNHGSSSIQNYDFNVLFCKGVRTAVIIMEETGYTESV